MEQSKGNPLSVKAWRRTPARPVFAPRPVIEVIYSSSSSRSAAPMPPNSDLYCVAPAPATGRQASCRRRAPPPPPHTENHSLPQLHPPAARLSTADKLVKLKS
ncbi:hypothetical protein CK203_076795 [Vitis vinifera]|uniref:Uncharacterized protein n=1 Tax=Vitis vinifera TaxID=29760 RepID=A0A438EPE4_VITVI|nr:hypothetical protein CK203_076795 [Vitis vinifera]